MFEMLMSYIRAAVKREEGQALVEYALILSLVSVGAIAGLQLIGANVLQTLTTVAGQI
jgi:Flp pilus assembly pilin Flp